uniref:Uncharacterized protein n=1 Tax=Strongyloides stercoralis TaxID=6248 RepID=A0AAF5DMG2_STRER
FKFFYNKCFGAKTSMKIIQNMTLKFLPIYFTIDYDINIKIAIKTFLRKVLKQVFDCLNKCKKNNNIEKDRTRYRSNKSLTKSRFYHIIKSIVFNFNDHTILIYYNNQNKYEINFLNV